MPALIVVAALDAETLPFCVDAATEADEIAVAEAEALPCCVDAVLPETETDADAALEFGR